MNNISKAFVAAKREFSPALKTSSNPHFRSKYADLAGCLEAVNEALLAQGIAVFQETSECADGVIIETVFLHESGETLRGGKLHVPAAKHDPQGYGSALTYARRYSLMAACGIAAEDDDGNAASRPKSSQARNPLDTVSRPQETAASHPLFIPGQDDPHSVHPDQASWCEAYQAMMAKVENGKGLLARAKMTKLRELKEANGTQLERLDAGLRAKVIAEYGLRIKRLGAQNSEEEAQAPA